MSKPIDPIDVLWNTGGTALPEGVVIMREPTDALTKALIEARAATDAEVRLMRDAMLAGRVLVELIDQERAAADRLTDRR